MNKQYDKDKIDIVITWVDGSDPEWQKQKLKYLIDEATHDTIGYDKSKYRDLGNLKYLFRGIEQFAPWVNRVHFVTSGHLPEWLNKENPKINIVRHDEYIPKKYLPTFSSHPIELNLHRIKGLSEHFVYFNDDTFILKKMKKTDFFKNGLPCDQAQLQLTTSKEANDIFPHIVFNDIAIINKFFKKGEVIKLHPFNYFNFRYSLKTNIRNVLLMPYKDFPGFFWSHLSSPFLRSTFEEVWQKNYDLLDQTCSNKFRNIQDVNQYLFKAWQFTTGKFHPINITKKGGQYFNISSQTKEVIDAINNQKHSLICINDNVNVNNFEKIKLEIISSFDKIFPDKSSFEL
jgi:Stealth protein CR2, conserved region 2/Stealth protein CR1, conserved region 1